MTFAELIHVLITRDIRLIPQRGGRLDVDGPAKVLTSELIEAVRHHKAEIPRRMAAVERAGIEPEG